MNIFFQENIILHFIVRKFNLCHFFFTFLKDKNIILGILSLSNHCAFSPQIECEYNNHKRIFSNVETSATHFIIYNM